MKSFRSNKLVVGFLILAVVGVATFGIAGKASAFTIGSSTPSNTNGVQLPNFFSCASSLGTCLVYIVSYLINGFLGLLVDVGAFLIELGLALDQQVFTSPTVQKGFSVALSLANLGFVLGIIIIALATILQSQTYGIKKMLWKLVAMAILVNFGLVITAPIVGFADNLSLYFINASGGQTGFVTNLTTAFGPQSILQSPSLSSNSSGSNFVCGTAALILAGPAGALACSAAASLLSNTSGSNGGADQFMQATLSLLFSATFIFIVAVTFIAIGVMLVIRYAWLAILLILLPFAWLSWIFPGLSKNFSKWWHEFIRWTFFPTAALFFIYLAFQSVSQQGGQITVSGATLPASAGSGSALALILQSGAGVTLQTALNEIVLIALCLGGLFAANSLSITGASTAINFAKGTGNAVYNFTAKQSKKGARLAYQKAGGGNLTKNLRAGQTGKAIREKLQNVPVARHVGTFAEKVGDSWLGSKLQNLAGRPLDKVTSNEEYLKDAQKNAPKSWEAAKNDLKSNMTTEKHLAAIEVGIKEGKITGEEEMWGGKKVKDFLSNPDLVDRYGAGKIVKDFDNMTLANTNIRNSEKAQKAYNNNDTLKAQHEYAYDQMHEQAIGAGLSEEEAARRAKETAEQTAPSPKVLVVKDIKDAQGNILHRKGDMANAWDVEKNAKEEFFRDSPKDAFSKSNVNALLGASADLETFRKRLNDIANLAPQIVPTLIKKMNSATLARFTGAYDPVIKDVIEQRKRELEEARASGDRERIALAEARHKNAVYGRTGAGKATKAFFSMSASESRGKEKEHEDEGGDHDGGASEKH